MKKRKYIETGVVYYHAWDRFVVPYGGVRVWARGEAVRRALNGQLPRNGVHLRDVIIRCSPVAVVVTRAESRAAA